MGLGSGLLEHGAITLGLYVGAVRAPAVYLHDLARHLAPRVVHIGHQLLPLAVSQPEVMPVLDAERQVRDGAEGAQDLGQG